MSFPFRAGVRPDTFSRLVEYLRSVVERFPDERTGADTVYSMADVALGAFSVFFLQSPSFLDFQRTLQVAKGCNNALTLFGITQIPSDNQTRNLLDPVPPAAVLPVFAAVVQVLQEGDPLQAYRSIHGDLLVAMDGTQYFSSTKIHCPPVQRNPASQRHPHLLAYRGHPRDRGAGQSAGDPAGAGICRPQDGHDKQDCENAAAKRWLGQFAAQYRPLGITILGDDLYCKQPLCEAIRREGLNFILVCKPDSHPTLSEWVAGLAATDHVSTLSVSRRHGKRTETDTHRFVNQVPLRDGDDALMVNWCELTTTRHEGKVTYHNAFATHHHINSSLAPVIAFTNRIKWLCTLLNPPQDIVCGHGRGEAPSCRYRLSGNV
jgi:hypothetical protein